MCAEMGGRSRGGCCCCRDALPRDLGYNLGYLPLDVEALPCHVANKHRKQMLQRGRRRCADHMLQPARAHACAQIDTRSQVSDEAAPRRDVAAGDDGCE